MNVEYIKTGSHGAWCYNWVVVNLGRLENKARNTKEIIGERVTHFRTVRAANHGFWGGKIVSDQVFLELKHQLIDPENKSYSFEPSFII